MKENKQFKDDLERQAADSLANGAVQVAAITGAGLVVAGLPGIALGGIALGLGLLAKSQNDNTEEL